MSADRTPESLAFLALHDTDGFSRWDAMQALYSSQVHSIRKSLVSKERIPSTESPSPLLLSLFGELLEEFLSARDDGEQKALLAAMLRPPSE